MLSMLALSALSSVALGNDLPSGTLGFYCLIADDTVTNYTSTDNWQPALYDYQINGANVIWLTFINPELMPAVPPAMSNLAMCKGQTGCPATSTPVIFSIGGQAYSSKPWSWLSSQSAAESMAAEVAQWSTKYGADGIDLDIEGAAGNSQTAADNLVAFAKKLRELNPKMLITQPVYGYPQIAAENTMVNEGFTKNGDTNSLIDSVGLMVYNGVESLQYVKDYGNGTSEWDGFPITVDVPYGRILPGIEGSASSTVIAQMASSVKSEGLGGFMVWFASVMDKTRGRNAFAYGSMDATKTMTANGAAWAAAIQTMNG